MDKGRKVGCYCMYDVKREGRISSIVFNKQFAYLVTLKQIAPDWGIVQVFQRKWFSEFGGSENILRYIFQ